MKISVLIAIYDEPPSLYQKALRSVIEQTLPPFELVIVNDNPTRSLEFGDLDSLLAERQIQVKLHNNAQNMGLGRSLNIGLEMTTGDFVARMDADDESLTERFERQARFLQNNPEYQFVFCAAKDDALAQWADHRSLNSATFETHFFKGNPFRHATMMARREPYQLLGYKQKGRTEDHDLYFRMAKHGYRAGYVAHCGYIVNKMVKYDYRNKRVHQQKMALAQLSQVLLLSKNMPTISSWVGFWPTYRRRVRAAPRAVLILLWATLKRGVSAQH